MKVSINGATIKTFQDLLTSDEYSKIIRINRWSTNKDRVDIDLTSLCDLSLLNLYNFACGLSGHNNISACTQIKQWQDVKKNPAGGIARSLNDVASLMRAYIDSAPNKCLFRQLGDDNCVPYLVTGIKYSPAQDYAAAVVSISLAAHNDFSSGKNWNDKRGRYLRLYEEDCLGKTMGEILQASSYFLETKSRMQEYLLEMENLAELSDKVGQQVKVFGKVVSKDDSWWGEEEFRPVERSGSPAKMVIDPKEKDFAPSAKSIPFWGNELMDIPSHPFLDLFDLESHTHKRCHVNNIKDYTYDKDIGDKLVLDDEAKELLEILVDNASDEFEDIVSGKQGGSIILCAGPPGVGKTLTAEIYSEVMGRPLYRVQSSQLGVSVESLEHELKNVLSRAERWGAILLIDEADVYVRNRGSEIEQNAIVGVFLRLLEYYRGVLFLTTNMETSIDDAIVSRVTARLDYRMPTEQQQRDLWLILSEQNSVCLSENEISKVLVNHPNLSGRDIKNMLKLSSRVAKAKGIEVTAKLIERIAKFK